MQSYQFFITLSQDTKIHTGRLGLFLFPRGLYIYSGSAKRNIDKRIERHLSKIKKLHWHIDYFLMEKETAVIKVLKSELEECELNRSVDGKIIVKGFGSTDCKKKLAVQRARYQFNKFCKTHLWSRCGTRWLCRFQ